MIITDTHAYLELAFLGFSHIPDKSTPQDYGGVCHGGVWTSAYSWLYTRLWMTCQKHKPSISMTHVACESKLRSVARSSLQPCPGNWVAIERAVVYYAGLPTHLVQELNVSTVPYQLEETLVQSYKEAHFLPVNRFLSCQLFAALSVETPNKNPIKHPPSLLSAVTLIKG